MRLGTWFDIAVAWAAITGFVLWLGNSAACSSHAREVVIEAAERVCIELAERPGRIACTTGGALYDAIEDHPPPSDGGTNRKDAGDGQSE